MVELGAVKECNNFISFILMSSGCQRREAAVHAESIIACTSKYCTVSSSYQFLSLVMNTFTLILNCSSCCVKNPKEADAMTKIQSELDETKIILVSNKY